MYIVDYIIIYTYFKHTLPMMRINITTPITTLGGGHAKKTMPYCSSSPFDDELVTTTISLPTDTTTNTDGTNQIEEMDHTERSSIEAKYKEKEVAPEHKQKKDAYKLLF